jgi:hypothetical protein
MSISTASDLQTAVANWANRTDLTDRFGEFVALFEAKANRRLRVRAMEASFDSRRAGERCRNPADLVPGLQGTAQRRHAVLCAGTPPPAVGAGPADQATPPYYFAVTDTQVVCWPQAGSIKGTYYKRSPPSRPTARTGC